jgi:hypothetical protein
MSEIIVFLYEILLGICATLIFEFILKTNKTLRDRYYHRHEIILGYHTHHSMYGLLLILVGIVLFFTGMQASTLFCIAFGIGIIIQHTLSSGGRLVFIEKQRDTYKDLGKGIIQYQQNLRDKKAEAKEKIMDLLIQKGKVSNKDAAKTLKLSSATVRRYFDELQAENRVKQVGVIGQSVYYSSIQT